MRRDLLHHQAHLLRLQLPHLALHHPRRLRVAGELRDGRELVQCGVDFVRFWKFSGANLSSKPAIFGARGRIQAFLCIGWVGNFAVVGTYDGHLYRFLGRQLDTAVPAHNGAVNTIATTNEGICTGGKDGLVKIWSTGLDLKFARDLFDLGSVKSPIQIGRAHV